MKVEIASLKTTQTEVELEMKKLENQRKLSKVSLTNGL